MEKLDRLFTISANLAVLVGIVFLAIEVQQNTENLKMNRQIALADAYSARNSVVQSAQVDAAMSADFADVYVKWQSGGVDSLTAAERFRVESWEIARIFRTEIQYDRWEKGLLPEEFIETLRLITDRFASDWRDLGLLWIPIGGYREEVIQALQRIDLEKPVVSEGS